MVNVECSPSEIARVIFSNGYSAPTPFLGHKCLLETTIVVTPKNNPADREHGSDR